MYSFLNYDPGFFDRELNKVERDGNDLEESVWFYRNFENYRLRVLTHCGWDEIINRVRMNAHPPLIG